MLSLHISFRYIKYSLFSTVHSWYTMLLLLLLRLCFGLFARFCVLHIHIPFLHLCFCLFVFLYLSTPSLSSSSPSFFAHSLLHAICLSRLRIAHCYFYLNYLKIYPNTNTLTLYHIPLHQASTPVMSIALFYNTRTEHEQTEQLSESCVCVWASICIIVVRILLLLLSVVVVMFLLS